LLHKVSKSSGDFALVVETSHRLPHTPQAPPSLTSFQEHQEPLPDIITNIPARQVNHHGHLEEHQELIKRRSRAARKEEQGDSKVASQTRSSRTKLPQAQDQEGVEGHQN
jgi:hypothetical protein